MLNSLFRLLLFKCLNGIHAERWLNKKSSSKVVWTAFEDGIVQFEPPPLGATVVQDSDDDLAGSEGEEQQ